MILIIFFSAYHVKIFGMMERQKAFVVEGADSTLSSVGPFLFPSGKRGRYFVSPSGLNILKLRQIPHQVVEVIATGPLRKRITYPLKSFLYAMPEEGAIDEVCVKMLASKRNGKLPYAIFLGRNADLEPGGFICDRAGGKRTYQWKFCYEKPKGKSLSAAFPKFLKAVKDPKTKLVLSFGSGGLRLFAHPSMMKFIETIGAKPYVSEIWGCSGGSLAGLACAMGVPPERIEQEGYDIYNHKFHFELTPSLWGVAKNIVLDAVQTASPGVMQGFASAQKAILTALRHLIRNRKLEIPFYCLAYNIRKQRAQILTPLRVSKKIYGDQVVQANAMDAVVASSSIPIVYVPKLIRRGRSKEQYLDGGTAEEIPLASIYRKWLLDRERGKEKRTKLMIVGVDLFPRIAQPWLDLPILNQLPFVDLINFGLELVDLVRKARIQEQTEPLRRDPNVKVLIVTLPLRTLSVLNPHDIPTIIKSAQTTFLEQMLALEKSL